MPVLWLGSDFYQGHDNMTDEERHNYRFAVWSLALIATLGNELAPSHPKWHEIALAAVGTSYLYKLLTMLIDMRRRRLAERIGP